MSHYQYQVQMAEDLNPYANNSRVHDAEQVQQLVKSIKEFGFTQPILVDESGVVIAGHGRLEAANLLGIREVPTIILHGLSDAQKMAYVIADNKLALNATWDEDMLKMELESLREMEYDIDLTGFAFADEEIDFSDEGESLFEVDDVSQENSDPKKTDDGYAEFAVVMQYENKMRFLKAINNLKNEHDTGSTEEVLMIMCEGYL